ncbi:hypothetical protein [Nocardia sp. BMG111209]|uniref:DUF7064 domain-containing protein n=1 Tax=Nocardia sp. BMG111209 TaxID=1160137 RepID=UPI00039B5173|nr:hypothetical protein [Nocardia sp. BMG111209]
MFAETIDPQHEFRHRPDGSANYNESTYYNFASASTGIVGWVRAAVQQNRSAAQSTALIFLPDGRTLAAFEKAAAIPPDAFEVGSLAIEIDEPHARQRLTFTGDMSEFTEPRALSDPGAALRAAPKVGVALRFEVAGDGMSFGTDGNDPAHVLEDSLAVGHYEQFVRVGGELRVGDRSYPMAGGGLRDHSWGPREWSGLRYHRWVTAILDDGSAVMALEVSRHDGGLTRRAAVVSDGVTAEATLDDLRLDWTPDGFGRRVDCALRAPAGAFRLTGTVRRPEQFVPLRHVTAAADGTRAITRIGYSAYEFGTDDGRHGLGIVEILDQLVDGRPIGMP